MSAQAKFPPAIQVILIAIAVYFTDSVIRYGHIEYSWLLPTAIISISLGIGVILIAGMTFKKASTTVNPLHPEHTTTLVIHGIYAYSRNPMYVGFFLILLGWIIYLGALFSLIWLAVFAWSITKFQILPEEQILEKKFPTDFRAYQSKVRRWI